MGAVVFDFDGTITYKSVNVWKEIWQELGYDIGENSYFREIFKKFLTKEITHQEWSDLTCEKFKARGLHISLLNKIADSMTIIGGFHETIKDLHKQGKELYIVSGSVKQVIERAIGNDCKYFHDIKGNEMIFDDDGYLESIKGTKYDFEGKALFIEELKSKKGIRAKDIHFVGNSTNDEFAYTTGCNTFCINPKRTCINNKTVWHCTQETDNIKVILDFINKGKIDNENQK